MSHVAEGIAGKLIRRHPHVFGEVEAVFGLWVVVLIGAITYDRGWATVLDYVGHRVNFTEPMFVVVIMAIASTRPVLRFAEQCMRAVARLGRESVGAWWLVWGAAPKPPCISGGGGSWLGVNGGVLPCGLC